MIKPLKLIALSLALILVQFIDAQTTSDFISLKNFTPPSPEAAALGRYGQIPVSYSSGIPSIDIPLYTVSSRKLSVPLSLSYHASGIKVEDIATTAGLGWVLNAGGAISRNVVGKADEIGMLNPQAYQYKDRPQLEGKQYDPTNDSNYYYLSHLASGDWDAQSDVYDINTPSFTGRFVYDIHTKEVQYTPVDKQLKITMDPSGASFSVIDDNGVKYIFAETEYTDAHASHNITAWFTTMIVSADLTDTIYFKYKNAATFQDVFNSQSYSITQDLDFSQPGIGPNYCPVPNVRDHFNSSYTYFTYGRKLLDSIQFSNGYVKFNYINDRQDPGNERLSKIIIGNGSGIIKNIELVHSYFQSNTQATINGVPVTVPDRAAKRLRLDAVEFEDNASALVNKYSLEYNTQALPYYYGGYDNGTPLGKTTAYDLWGYYNGSTSQYLFPSHFRDYIYTYLVAAQSAPSNTILDDYDRNSVDRYPNPDYTQASMLTRIVYPTGGFSYFEYENNKVANSGDSHDFTGGLRVKKITTSDNLTDKPTIKTYSYGDSSGTGISISRVVPDDFYFDQPVITQNSNVGGSTTTLLAFCGTTNFYINTNPTTAINYYGGSPVFYTNVTEYNGYPGDNNGKTEYVFDYEQDSVYASPDTYKYWNFSTDKSWARGQLLSTKIYKNQNQNYTLLKSTTNTYAHLGMKTVAVGYLCEQSILFPNYPLDGYLQYQLFVGGDATLLTKFEYQDVVLAYGVKKLIRTEETEFANNNITITKEISYEGNGHLYPTKTVSYTSDNGNITQIDKFPQDKALISSLGITASSAIDGMVANNILAVPIENETYRNGTFLSRNRTDYQDWNGQGHFYEQFHDQQIAQNPMESRVQYKAYDANGNATWLSKVGDVDVTYLWGYNNQYPVAKVVGKSYPDVLLQSGINLSTLNAPSDDNTMRAELAKLRNLTGVLATTSTYAPLIGKTSQTEPNGITTFYEYDNFLRLSVVRDRDSHILKQYSYQDISGTGIPIVFAPIYPDLPDWEIYNQTRCKPFSSTGEEQQAYKDQNPHSSTYQQVKWVTTGVSCSCSAGLPCNGIDQKVIEGCCQKGIKVYTSSVQPDPDKHPDQWICYFHYEWSDGSWSQTYNENSSSECILIAPN